MAVRLLRLAPSDPIMSRSGRIEAGLLKTHVSLHLRNNQADFTPVEMAAHRNRRRRLRLPAVKTTIAFGITIMRLGDPTDPRKPTFDLFVGVDDRNADHLAAEMDEQWETGIVGPELGFA